MTRHEKGFLILSLAAALALIVCSSLNYRRLSSRLRETNGRLSSSRKTWESTSAVKEELQDRLSVLRDELKEKDLSLAEDRKKAAEISEEIGQLKTDIALLSSGETSQD